MALYQALTSLSLPGGLYAVAADLIDDTGAGRGWPVPSSWVPPADSVNALDADATSKVYAAGPRFAEPWLSVPRPKATTYWYPDGKGLWFLKGSEALGAKFGSTS